MFRFTLRDLWSRRRRLIATSTAVVLGVAFLFATLTLADTLRAGIGSIYAEQNAGLDVTVRNSTVLGTDDLTRRSTLDASLADELGAIDGVDRVRPVIEGTAQIVAADGTDLGGNGPPTMAINWIDDEELNAFEVVDGRPPAPVGADQPVEIVIDQLSANEGDLDVGSLTTVKTPQATPAKVVGIASFAGRDSLGAATWVAFTDDDARRLLLFDSAATAGAADTGAAVTSLAVVAADGVDVTALRDSITRALPAEAEALTGAELTEEYVAAAESDFIGFIRVFLLAFAAIALLVATLSIYNTFSILVAQRTRQSALLRAIGASRRQVLSATLLEGLATAVVATAIGLVVGCGLGLGLRELLAAFAIDLPGSFVVSATSIAVAATTGIVVTVVACLLPAVRAAGVAPLAALREAAVDRSSASWGRAMVGGLLLASGVLVAITATSSASGAFTRAGIGALLVVVGAVVIGPVVVGPVNTILGAPLHALRGESGRMAMRNARRNPRRTAATASGLLVGTAVVVLFTVLGSSVTASIDDTIDRTFGGDLVVLQQSFSGASIDPGFAPAIEATDDIETAAAMAIGPALVGGVESEVTAVDPARFGAVLDLGLVAGDVGNLAPGQFAASADEAESRGWMVDDVIEVALVDGSSRSLTLGALYTETDIAGDILVDVADINRAAGFEGDLAVLIGIADGVDEVAAAATVDSLGEAFGTPAAQTRTQYVDSIVSEVQILLGLIYGLLGLAILIAVMGIANTLALSMHERTRELGLLRAVGQTRSQLRSTVRWEALLIALFGTLVGVGLGVFLGWALTRAVATQEGFGVFAVPPVPIAVIVAVGALAGVIAAVRPARRAARLDVLDALATD
ncbi:MAG TPA: FtsX-like permease family protein [Ilumatobacteraceae bacterium]|nr:FtsX-like permease family protein [Ilumatobacteraceae bacterium]